MTSRLTSTGLNSILNRVEGVRYSEEEMNSPITPPPNSSAAPTAALFLEKTYEMIETCPNDIANWSEQGDSFIVRNPKHFAEHVIPIYFKHKNFSSFVRQLNFYSFRKIRTDSSFVPPDGIDPKNWWEFKHDLFRRGQRELLLQIKRKVPDNAREAVLGRKSEIERLRDEVGYLRQQVQLVNYHMENMMDTFLFSPKEENEPITNPAMPEKVVDASPKVRPFERSAPITKLKRRKSIDYEKFNQENNFQVVGGKEKNTGSEEMKFRWQNVSSKKSLYVNDHKEKDSPMLKPDEKEIKVSDRSLSSIMDDSMTGSLVDSESFTLRENTVSSIISDKSAFDLSSPRARRVSSTDSQLQHFLQTVDWETKSKAQLCEVSLRNSVEESGLRLSENNHVKYSDSQPLCKVGLSYSEYNSYLEQMVSDICKSSYFELSTHNVDKNATDMTTNLIHRLYSVNHGGVSYRLELPSMRCFCVLETLKQVYAQLPRMMEFFLKELEYKQKSRTISYSLVLSIVDKIQSNIEFFLSKKRS